jgi:hypothetical protein
MGLFRIFRCEPLKVSDTTDEHEEILNPQPVVRVWKIIRAIKATLTNRYSGKVKTATKLRVTQSFTDVRRWSLHDLDLIIVR